MTRLWIHTLVILSATGLTTLIFYKPEAIQGEALEVVKYAITSLWTLVAIIVRDNRNRGMRNDKGDNK